MPSSHPTAHGLPPTACSVTSVPSSASILLDSLRYPRHTNDQRGMPAWQTFPFVFPRDPGLAFRARSYPLFENPTPRKLCSVSWRTAKRERGLTTVLTLGMDSRNLSTDPPSATSPESGGLPRCPPKISLISVHERVISRPQTGAARTRFLARARFDPGLRIRVNEDANIPR